MRARACKLTAWALLIVRSTSPPPTSRTYPATADDLTRWQGFECDRLGRRTAPIVGGGLNADS
eukprot:1487621-Pyramimonas_sp.AAC.1